jgi:hypothetical protein
MSTKSILKAGEFPNQFYVPAGTVIKHKRRYCIVLRFTSSSSAASLHSFLFPALPYTGQAGSQSKNFSLHIDQDGSRIRMHQIFLLRKPGEKHALSKEEQYLP